MVSGRSGIGPITRFDATGFPVQIAAEVKDFHVEDLIDRKMVKRLDLFAQYAMVAAREAFTHAGLSPYADGNPRFGMFIGTGIGGLNEIVAGAEAFRERGFKGLSPFFIPRALSNLAGGHLAIEMGAQGPSLCVATACATGNHSIGEAFRAIRYDDVDVCLAGGAEGAITGLGLGGFMVMKALSKRNDATASRPFDEQRDGFVMGEGAGIVVVEELEHARRRGATIYAEVVGYAHSNDAHHETAPPPGGAGAARAMRAALKSASMDPEDVDYINAHGTSTPMNDATETQAIKGVFGEHAYKLAVSSTKSVTGHMLGAAGGVEAIASALALYHGVLPPTAHLENPDPACDLDYVPRVARQVQARAAVSNAFGFGGTNATLVFRRFTD
jgi:3-oxoacyl-[acyl-carrier-protein] synthase II